MRDINIWAVLVAAASSFVLGGLWYSPLLFLKPWTNAAGREPSLNPPVFIASALFALIAAGAFALWLGPHPPLQMSMVDGAAVGLCFVLPSLGVNYAFAKRGITLWLIDGGYHVVRFALFGLIFGLWH